MPAAASVSCTSRCAEISGAMSTKSGFRAMMASVLGARMRPTEAVSAVTPSKLSPSSVTPTSFPPARSQSSPSERDNATTRESAERPVFPSSARLSEPSVTAPWLTAAAPWLSAAELSACFAFPQAVQQSAANNRHKKTRDQNLLCFISLSFLTTFLFVHRTDCQ